jgi:hypothetical protein
MTDRNAAFDKAMFDIYRRAKDEPRTGARPDMGMHDAIYYRCNRHAVRHHGRCNVQQDLHRSSY